MAYVLVLHHNMQFWNFHLVSDNDRVLLHHIMQFLTNGKG